jgi:hypothetical protein
MIVIRNTFTAKPGSASKLAAQFKDALTAAKVARGRVLTDMTGNFNTVVLEYEADDLQQFEATMRQYETDQAFRDKMKGYTELYVTGRREIFRVA